MPDYDLGVGKTPFEAAEGNGSFCTFLRNAGSTRELSCLPAQPTSVINATAQQAVHSGRRRASDGAKSWLCEWRRIEGAKAGANKMMVMAIRAEVNCARATDQPDQGRGAG